MRLNPELRRQLWLELSLHRLLAAPLVIAILLGVSAILTEDVAPALALTAALLFMLVTVAWGSAQSYNSMVEELSGRTWDNQRMSNIGPATMVAGKLLGSTVFAWYSGLICLAILAGTLPEPAWLAPWSSMEVVFGCLLSALLLQGFGLFFALLEISAGKGREGGRSRQLGLLTLLLFWMIMQLALSPGREAETQLEWFGTLYDRANFTLWSLLACVGWLWFGSYRLMAGMLAVRTIPWGSLAFTLFLTYYLAGFEAPRTASDLIAPIGSLVALVLLYIGGWMAPRDWGSVRRSLWTWRRLAVGEALTTTPGWVNIALLGLGWALWAALHPDWAVPMADAAPSPLLHLLPITLLLIALRDIALLYLFSLGQRPQRAELMAAIYILLLHTALPALLNLLDLAWLASPAWMLFEPTLLPGSWGPWIATLQLLLVVALLGWRLRDRRTP